MEIKYKNTLDNELIEASKIQWRYAQKKSATTILLCFLISTGFLMWGLLTMSSSGFWNFKTSMGLAYAMLTLILLVSFYQRRTEWLSNCEKAIANKNEKSLEYIFTDEKIIIKETNSYAEFGWDVITGFRTHNNFLFLYIHSSKSSYFTIDRNDMTEVDFAALLSFASNKIPLEK